MSNFCPECYNELDSLNDKSGNIRMYCQRCAILFDDDEILDEATNVKVDVIFKFELSWTGPIQRKSGIDIETTAKDYVEDMDSRELFYQLTGISNFEYDLHHEAIMAREA